MKKVFVLLLLILLVIGAAVFFLISRKGIALPNALNTSNRDFSAESKVSSNEKVSTENVNAYRGTFLSYVEGTVLMKDNKDVLQPVEVEESKVIYSCVDEATKLNGKSLYESEVNIDKFVLNGGSKLFTEEIFIPPSEVYLYQDSNAFYITKNMPGVLPGNVDMRVIFIGCKPRPTP